VGILPMKARDNIHWLTSNRVVRFTLNTVGRNSNVAMIAMVKMLEYW